MTRILFVDDEPNVRTGLQRLLRPQRRDWDMSFAEGGEAALSLMAVKPCDVVVTDVRMPGMDGVALLEKVRQLYPQAGRIVLSGQTEIKLALRAVRLAHQFLPKPCDAEVLRVAIERACSLRRVLASESLGRVICSMGDLPTAPRVYSSLVKALSNPQASTLEDVARIIEQDVGLSAKVLQLVNSAFFGFSRDIASIRDAVKHLGLDIIETLVASLEATEAFAVSDVSECFSVEESQSHARLTARIASSFPLPTKLCDTAAAGGLLHDVGKLVLASHLPEQLREATRVAIERQRPLHEVEVELFGISHAEIGAYLLNVWGLPVAVTETVAHHHNPLRVPHRELNPVSVVYLADLLAHEFDSLCSLPTAKPLLAELGVQEQFPLFRERARQAATDVSVWVPSSESVSQPKRATRRP